MDFATIVSAVSAVGFPIVFCLILYKTMLDQNKKHKEAIKCIKCYTVNNAVYTRAKKSAEENGKFIHGLYAENYKAYKCCEENIHMLNYCRALFKKTAEE